MFCLTDWELMKNDRALPDSLEFTCSFDIKFSL